MNDLIRRKDAIDYFVTNIGVVDADGYAVDDYDERVKAWTERFSGIPSVELEQKTGHWIDTDNYFYRWKCSECGCHTRDAEPNYCPSCGADMRMRGE